MLSDTPENRELLYEKLGGGVTHFTSWEYAEALLAAWDENAALKAEVERVQKERGIPLPHDPEYKHLGELYRLTLNAHQVINDLCQGRRKWGMSIPARPDHDPDIVISNALIALECALTDSVRQRKNLGRIISHLISPAEDIDCSRGGTVELFLRCSDIEEARAALAEIEGGDGDASAHS